MIRQISHLPYFLNSFHSWFSECLQQVFSPLLSLFSISRDSGIKFVGRKWAFCHQPNLRWTPTKYILSFALCCVSLIIRMKILKKESGTENREILFVTLLIIVIFFFFADCCWQRALISRRKSTWHKCRAQLHKHKEEAWRNEENMIRLRRRVASVGGILRD